MASSRASSLAAGAGALLLALCIHPAAAFLPYQNPPSQWGASNYDMSSSSITMAANYSGMVNTSISDFGIVSLDWSTGKKEWAAAKPMNCEENMHAQVATLKAANPSMQAFVYAQLVKALPWYSTVRAKLEDPAYAGYFISFSPSGPWGNGSYHVPACDTNYDPPLCSALYHDQSQTPAVPTPSNPNPDGACVGRCDCGEGIPCGEYIFDHRNASMREWLINEVILGPSWMGSPEVSGLFIDDFWCSNILNGSCSDPAQGPTEVDANFKADTGLSDGDIRDITLGWLQTMTDAQAAILAAGGYTWSLIPGQANANAEPVMVEPSSCASQIRPACSAGSEWQSAPLMFGMHPGNASVPLASVDQDVAAFLLMRGPFAFIGYGEWGMTWPVGATWVTPNGTSTVARPPQMDANYGAPLGLCAETPGRAGVFSRAFEHADVSLDCNTWAATIVMH